MNYLEWIPLYAKEWKTFATSEERLKRLRVELKVPDVDDPEATGERTIRRPQEQAKKNAAKKKATGPQEK